MEAPRHEPESAFDYVMLRFAPSEIPADEEDPCRFIHDHRGEVLLARDDDEVTIGIFAAYYIDVVGALTEGASVFDVFDSYEHTIGYHDLYTENYDFKPRVVQAAGTSELWCPNLLALDRLVIYPQFRGRGRGLVALRGLMHHLRAGAGMIAMKPFPLQCESGYRSGQDDVAHGLDRFTCNYSVAMGRLRRYYCRLGFGLVHRGPFMVFGAERRLPSVSILQQAPSALSKSIPRRSNDACSPA